MPNRLANTSSPYLLQHQHNPVDWYPWCQEALEKARTEGKPIFLSIGYSACHWCHVMEHESFEDESIAAILNGNFVSIKVDREERPDLDQIYMQVVQDLTGSGGWPMSVFLTPGCKPFYGGTYWPPDNRWGRPGFRQVLLAVLDAWSNRRSQAEEQSEMLTERLRHATAVQPSEQTHLDPSWIEAAERMLLRYFDTIHGGFGGAPKFPHSMDLALILDLHSTEPKTEREQILRLSLDKMAAGGIYDHLGGGFARYSVDARWLVPHFEKMLYDNALLAGLYADAFRVLGETQYGKVVQGILNYLTRDISDPAGGIYSAEDADSEGEEGKFYIWTVAEVQQLLGDERAKFFCQVYDVTEKGNFEERNILNMPQPLSLVAHACGRSLAAIDQQLAEDRMKLFEHRQSRIRPGLDDKVLLGWNALAIIAFVKAYRATDEPRFLDRAQRIALFIFTQMRRGDQRLWHSWRKGHANLDAYLDDYSYLLEAVIELHQVDPQPQWICWALELANDLVAFFRSPDGGFYFTANDAEQLIVRTKDAADHSVPSGTAMAASGLLTLGWLTNREDFVQIAESTLKSITPILRDSPMAAGQSLRVLNRMLQGPLTLVLVGQHADSSWNQALAACRKLYLPNLLLVARLNSNESAHLQSNPLAHYFEGREPMNGEVTLFVCRNQTCEAPQIGLENIMQRIREFNISANKESI